MFTNGFKADINPTYEALQSLRAAPYEFHLTGSRFFNPEQANSNTDYDFFTEYSEEIYLWLENQGFHLDSREDYRNMPCEYILSKGNVQIQLVIDAAKKLRAQKLLHDLCFDLPGGFGYLSKKYRKLLWTRALCLVYTT